MELDYEAIKREVEDEVARNLSRLSQVVDGIAEIRERAARITAQATSRDGLISVWVNASGVLIELDLDDEVTREYAVAELAAEILQLTQTAAREAAQRVEENAVEIRQLADQDDDSGFDLSIPGLADLRVPTRPSMARPDSDERRFS